MAISYFSTVQDIRNLDEYISSAVRDDARVRQCIWKGDAIIRAGLRSLYTMDTALLELAPYAGPAQTPFALPDLSPAVTENAGTCVLGDVVIGSAAVTEVVVITFTSNNTFSVVGSASGSLGSGLRSSVFTSAGSKIVISPTCWSGTPVTGDKFYISIYQHKPLVVALSALFAAGILLKAAYQGGDISAKGKEYYSQAEDLLDRMQRPYEDDGLQLDSFSPRDISPQGIAYTVDMLGYDVSKYIDNEMTTWDDSTNGGGSLFGFFSGPIWVR